MPRIFISYRRSDSMSYTGRIYDYLINQFGQENVFKDVDDIPIGTNFRNIIISQISQSDVVLVIIGPTWLNTIDSFNTRRLENPNDFVRMEVETALNLKHVKVIPVLIDNALMPNAEDLPHQLQKIAFLNAKFVTMLILGILASIFNYSFVIFSSPVEKYSKLIN